MIPNMNFYILIFFIILFLIIFLNVSIALYAVIKALLFNNNYNDIVICHIMFFPPRIYVQLSGSTHYAGRFLQVNLQSNEIYRSTLHCVLKQNELFWSVLPHCSISYHIHETNTNALLCFLLCLGC